MVTKFMFASGSYIPEGDKPLGSGRYGEVWAVRSETGNIRRAVKINSPDHREVLHKEFETLKELENFDDENLILRAYELGETDDRRPCMLMDLMEAKPLRALAQELRRRVVLPGNQQMEWSLEDEILRVRVATQITSALLTAFKARIALTDLKIDNFYYDENWPQLIKVIDWNFVDTETPHAGFVNDTIPKLGDVFYEIFTGLSLREQEQEDRIGKINIDLFAKVNREQTWPMFWDQITFGTREIIKDMVFAGFEGKNQPYNLWSRWLTRRRLLADKEGLDKIFAVETADLAGELDITPDLEAMEAYSILRLINNSEHREARLREITHRYISGLVGDRDFHSSELSLLSARRSYTGSMRLDFWLLFTQLGLTADTQTVFADQIQDLPRRMEEYWNIGEIDALYNMLERISDKVNNYWTVSNQEVEKIKGRRQEYKKLIDHLFLTINVLQRIRQAEDLLFEDARTNNKWLPNFSSFSLKIISDLKESKWIFGYLQDTAHLPPRYDLVIGQFRKLLQYADALKRVENTNLELEFYKFIANSPWHNSSIGYSFKIKIDSLEVKIEKSITDYGNKAIESANEYIQKEKWELQDKISDLLLDLDREADIKNKISESVTYLNKKKWEFENELKILSGSLKIFDESQKSPLKITISNIKTRKRRLDAYKEGLLYRFKNFENELNKEYNILRLSTAGRLKDIKNVEDEFNKEFNVFRLSTASILRRIKVRRERLDIYEKGLLNRYGDIAKKVVEADKAIKETEDKLSLLKLDDRLISLSNKQKEIEDIVKRVETAISQVDSINLNWANQIGALVTEVRKVNRQADEILAKKSAIAEKSREIAPYFQQLQDIEKSQHGLMKKLESVENNFAIIDNGFTGIEKDLVNIERRVDFFEDRLRKSQVRLVLLAKRYKRVKRYLAASKRSFWPRLLSPSKDVKTKNIAVERKSSRYWLYFLIPIGIGVLIFGTNLILPRISGLQISSFFTKTEIPTMLPTATQKPTSIDVMPLNSPDAPTTHPSSTPVPSATLAITPTPEKVMATILKISTTLKGEPSEGSFNAQQFSDALTFNPNDQLAVAGKNKDNNWLLLYYPDPNGVWFGWADIKWLNPLAVGQPEELPVAVSCNFGTSGLPIFDEPNGKQLNFSKRNIVYLVVEIQDIWVKIEGGPGGGWVRKDLIKCSGDFSANSVAP